MYCRLHNWLHLHPLTNPSRLLCYEKMATFMTLPLEITKQPYNQYHILKLHCSWQSRTHNLIFIYTAYHKRSFSNKIFRSNYWWQGIPSLNRYDYHVTRLLNSDWLSTPAVSTRLAINKIHEVFVLTTMKICSTRTKLPPFCCRSQ